MNWKTKEVSTLVDFAKSPKGDEFPGIYAMGFPQNCWSLDNKRILMNTEWKRVNVSCVVN